MIVTVTPNPAVDRTLILDGFRWGEVNRAREHHVEASGKGVNVTGALLTNQVASTAVLPLGGSEGAQLADLLQAELVPFVPVLIADSVRVNISLVGRFGAVTKINELGPRLSDGEQAALVDAVVGLAGDATWVVASGSLPRGVEAGFYGDLAARVHRAGARFALDTSGLALLRGVAGEPDVIKPNVEELAAAVGRSLHTFGEVCAAAAELCASPKTQALVSLGPDGALLIHDGSVLHAEAPVGQPNSTVGAGDNLLAGFLAAGGDGAHALAEAVAWGSVAVRSPGSRADAVTDADRAQVRLTHEADKERLLTHPTAVPTY